MRGTLHLVAREDHAWLLGLTAPRQEAGGARRLAQEGVTPGDAERAVAVVERALADDGPLTRAELGARIAAAGVRSEGQALPHLLALAARRGIARARAGARRRAALRPRARLARRGAGRPARRRGARRGARRARPALPRRPRAGDRGGPRGAGPACRCATPAPVSRAIASEIEAPAAAISSTSRAARRRRAARGRARAPPAPRLRPVPARLEGPRVRRARPARAARPPGRRDAPRGRDGGRPRRGHLERAPPRRSARGRGSRPFGRIPAAVRAALDAEAADVARFEGLEPAA